MTKTILEFSWKISWCARGVRILVIQVVKVLHYLNHCPSFGLWNKPQQKRTTEEGVSHENQEAELAEAILDGNMASDPIRSIATVTGSHLTTFCGELNSGHTLPSSLRA